jgi:hypothetical protein
MGSQRALIYGLRWCLVRGHESRARAIGQLRRSTPIDTCPTTRSRRGDLEAVAVALSPDSLASAAPSVTCPPTSPSTPSRRSAGRPPLAHPHPPETAGGRRLNARHGDPRSRPSTPPASCAETPAGELGQTGACVCTWAAPTITSPLTRPRNSGWSRPSVVACARSVQASTYNPTAPRSGLVAVAANARGASRTAASRAGRAGWWRSGSS